jgi:hypothetical protein
VGFQSSHSSKCSTKGEEVYTRITRKFDSMANTIIRHLKLSDNSPSIGDANFARHLPHQGSISHLMQIINGIAEDMLMLPTAYVDMCRNLKDKHWTDIILNITKKGQREWVASFMLFQR